MTTSEAVREGRKKKETEAEAKTRIIGQKYSGKTDRQLLEEQTNLAEIRNEYTKSIKNNVQFFFWITMISIIIWFIASFLVQTELLDSNY